MSNTLQELRDEIAFVKNHLKEMEDKIGEAEKDDYESRTHKDFMELVGLLLLNVMNMI